jgi:phage terminase small subunit
MARPRKPTATLAIEGAFKKNKSRTRRDPRTTGPLGPPPNDMRTEEKDRWREIVRIAPEGVLRNADRGIVEMCAKLWSILKKDGFGGRYGLNTGQASLLKDCFSKLGMTPSDRSKVAPTGEEEEKPESPYAEFAAEGAGASKPN